ncbi:MAG: acyl-CoA dehydrogenase [Gammaproteobacteria bacterium]|nr:MAG: acyl-CoA dehydrogenase [Gammaproteobacteria bacterium]
MFIDYTDEQKALRKELRTYFSKLMTPDVREEIRGKESGELFNRLIKQMGTDGWLAIGWPKEYGGQGRTTQEQLVFFEEALLAGAPIPFVTLNTVGPALMSYGSEEHKKQFLPGIAAGTMHFAIGYTEPNAGTDLAALGTTAVKDGDHYIINGTKVFTSGAEGADYVWLACRTDNEAPKHKGITMFIVDAKSKGFSVAPIHTVGGFRTNMTYYENVRVHESMIVGQLNKGWQLITAQLNHERVGLAAWGINGWSLFRRTMEWARTANDAGVRPIDDVGVQMNLAEAYSRLEAMRVLNARMAWELDRDAMNMNPALASGLKVYSTEAMIEVCRLLMEVIGPASLVRSKNSAAVLAGDLEHEYRRCQINTFGGGVNEIQRGLVANFGLGMPRHR